MAGNMEGTTGDSSALAREGGIQALRPEGEKCVVKAPTTLKGYLELPAVKQKLADAAGDLFKPEDMIRMTLIQASVNPDILRCTQESVLRALMIASQMKIEPSGLRGRGYIIPRKNRKTDKLEASFEPGTQGLMDVATRSGRVVSFSAHVVYAGDRFKYMLGLHEDIVHEPTMDAEERGEIVAAYAVATLPGGAKQFEVVLKVDIDKIKASSAAGNNGPWGTWYSEMARKTAVRRLCKYLPYEPMLDMALQASYEAEPDHDPAPSEQHSKSLAQRIRESVLDEPPAEHAEPIVTADGEVLS